MVRLHIRPAACHNYSMNSRIAIALIALALSGCGTPQAPTAATSSTPASAPAPDSGPGWTGLTQPEAVIEARQQLMMQIEEEMKPIDTIQVDPVRDPDRLRANAMAVAAMLRAVPHLFPPTTNLYDPKVEPLKTLALPALWENFDAFYQMAQVSVSAAEEFANTQDSSKLREASFKLRGTCDACHAVNLRKYVEPKAVPSDADFDFDKSLK